MTYYTVKMGVNNKPVLYKDPYFFCCSPFFTNPQIALLELLGRNLVNRGIRLEIVESYLHETSKWFQYGQMVNYLKTLWTSIFQILWIFHHHPLKTMIGRSSCKWYEIMFVLYPRFSETLNTLLKLHSTWKWMFGILISFWDCLFSGAMLVQGK